MFLKGFFLVCLALIVQEVVGEGGCPDPEEIKPCSCSENYFVILKCVGLNQVDTLKKIFMNTRRYLFDDFTLENSTLQYIPHEVFDEVKIKKIKFKMVTFVNTFDKIPKNPGVYSILLNKVRVVGGWDWSRLSLFTQLRELAITNIPMKRISSDFRPNINKKLQKLRMSWCGIKKLRDDEFQQFEDLEVFVATHDEIKTVKRTMFSRPSKLTELALEYNQISEIPADMFQDMPNLKFISLSHNRISALPWDTIKPVIGHLEILRLSDNPLRCDCQIQWLTFKKIEYVIGKCASPPSFKGKDLNDLTPQSFRC